MLTGDERTELDMRNRSRISPCIRRTCYEPLDSTHPDTQGSAPVTTYSARHQTAHVHRAGLACTALAGSTRRHRLSVPGNTVLIYSAASIRKVGTVMVGDLEGKFADRVRDLFGATWAHAVDLLAALLISIWVWAAVVPSHYTPGTPVPRPLSWWQAQVEHIGFHYPSWLHAVTYWQPLANPRLVGFVLATTAVVTASQAARSRTPGFRLVAMLSLVLGCQWFGFAVTMRTYGLLTLIPVSIAALLALRTRFDTKELDDGARVYTTTTIFMGLISGVGSVVVVPLTLPVGFLGIAAESLGMKSAWPTIPAESAAFESVLSEFSGDSRTVGELQTGEALRLFAAVAIVSQSPLARTRAARSLRRTPVRGWSDVNRGVKRIS